MKHARKALANILTCVLLLFSCSIAVAPSASAAASINSKNIEFKKQGRSVGNGWITVNSVKSIPGKHAFRVTYTNKADYPNLASAYVTGNFKGRAFINKSLSSKAGKHTIDVPFKFGWIAVVNVQVHFTALQYGDAADFNVLIDPGHTYSSHVVTKADVVAKEFSGFALALALTFTPGGKAVQVTAKIGATAVAGWNFYQNVKSSFSMPSSCPSYKVGRVYKYESWFTVDSRGRVVTHTTVRVLVDQSTRKVSCSKTTSFASPLT